jgi:serine/threonine protein kinase
LFNNFSRALHNHECYLTWYVKLQLAIDVCRGLDALHSRIGVVHRDIKAENVLLKTETEGGVTRIKGFVCDFGVSAPRQVALDENCFFGTIVFAAPELFDHQPKYSHQSDIYSFGCLLHELLFHRRPFETVEENGQIRPWNHDIGRESKAIFKKRRAAGLQMTMNVPIQAADGLPKFVPAGFLDLLHHCIERNPEDRPQSMRIIFERLETILASLSPDDDASQFNITALPSSSVHLSSNSCTSQITYTISGEQLDAFRASAPHSIADLFNQE